MFDESAHESYTSQILKHAREGYYRKALRYAAEYVVFYNSVLDKAIMHFDEDWIEERMGEYCQWIHEQSDDYSIETQMRITMEALDDMLSAPFDNPHWIVFYFLCEEVIPLLSEAARTGTEVSDEV
jgi:hypothetical protein